MIFRLPNLLATRNGRLTAFCLLYVTEGIPLGFAATAVASQLRRMGVGPAEIGAFVASFYLPWAFKWAFGPVIDVFRSQRFGHRRAWILATQLLLSATLLMLIWVPLPQGLGLFTGILLVHNSFGAMQDVAIDALAVNSLDEQERGLANGLMFFGASVGQAVGGAGVLYLMPYIGFQGSFVFVALAILAVTGFVVLPMKEAVVARVAEAGAATAAAVGGGWRTAVAEMREFAQQSFQSFLGSKPAFVSVFFALLPMGAMSLSLALQTNLAVELGMSDEAVADLSLYSSIVSGVFMVIGGLISDRLGHRRMLAVYTVYTSITVIYLAWVLWQAGYVLPRAPGSPAIKPLIDQLWIATLLFNVGMGLGYGTRNAVFMAVTNPRVAGTQFTAYMAMNNLAISFAASWQGISSERLGYPLTLAIDAGAGLLGLALLPLMGSVAASAANTGLCDAHAQGRARKMARVLGLLCLGFVPFVYLHDPQGAWADIGATLYTLVFVAAALFLYAATLLQPLSAGLRSVCGWLALAVLAIYLRKFVPADFAAAATLLSALVAVLTGLLLILLGGRSWPGLQVAEGDGRA